MSDSLRRALPPPTAALVPLDRATLDGAVRASRENARRRIIAPFHRTESDTLHRMFNAVQPDSYVRPHRHLDPPKAEAFVLLQGAAAFFTFGDDGAITNCVHLEAGGDVFGVDLLPGIFHCFVALRPDTVMYEVKDGPYVPTTDKSFAPWAPAEGTPEANAFLQSLHAECARRGLTP